MRPVPHSAELPVPKPPTNMTPSDSESNDEDVGQANNNMDCDSTFAGASSSNESHLLTKGDLNDIVRNLNLSKTQAELLGSRLMSWNLLRQDTKVCFTVGAMRNSRISFPWKMVSCFAIMFLLLWKFLAMNIIQISGLDSSKVRLKVVLLHNGNRFRSVPLAHAANMKQSYESMKLLLGKFKYDEFKWKLCGDLKVLSLLLRMQLGYTKFCCFLCEWDSRDKKNHYVNKLWTKRTSQRPGGKMFSILLLFFRRKFICPLCT